MIEKLLGFLRQDLLGLILCDTKRLHLLKARRDVVLHGVGEIGILLTIPRFVRVGILHDLLVDDFGLASFVIGLEPLVDTLDFLDERFQWIICGLFGIFALRDSRHVVKPLLERIACCLGLFSLPLILIALSALPAGRCAIIGLAFGFVRLRRETPLLVAGALVLLLLRLGWGFNRRLGAVHLVHR